MCDKSRNTWLCVHWQWNTLEWCQLNALQASPVVHLVTPLSCVSLSMNTQPNVPTIVTSCRHGSRDKTIVWWFLASLFFPENTCYKQRYAISKATGYYKKHINGTNHSLSAPKTNLESPDMAWMPWTRALPSYSYANEGVVSNMQTSNGSWCIGIKGEMSGTVCVTFTWDIYIYMSCL